jgi:hypothetical protein
MKLIQEVPWGEKMAEDKGVEPFRPFNAGYRLASEPIAVLAIFQFYIK